MYVPAVQVSATRSLVEAAPQPEWVTNGTKTAHSALSAPAVARASFSR
jgi:hypothetical protein